MTDLRKLMGQVHTLDAAPEPTDFGPTTRRVRDDNRSAVTVTLQVPAVFEYRDLASRAVSSVCEDAFASVCTGTDGDWSWQFVNELISAVGEAFNNVVAHAYGSSGAGTVEMELHWNRDGVTVKMSNSGQSFDFEAVPNINLDTPHENGMGVHIIRSFVDDVSYRPGSPNVLTLTKYFAQDRLVSAPEG